MTLKNTTLFKIIGPLSLALCALSSWYYWDLSFLIEDKRLPASQVVAPQANYRLASNYFNAISSENLKRAGSPEIVIVLSISVLALILYFLHVKGVIHLNRALPRQPLQWESVEVDTIGSSYIKQQEGAYYSRNSSVNHGNLAKAQNPPTGDYLENHLIPIVTAMIKGQYESSEITAYDAHTFNTLTTAGNHLAYDIKKIWDAFRYHQQSITIDMAHMYVCYRLFIPGLATDNLKAKHLLLLLGKIIKTFPNVKHITYNKANFGGKQYKIWIVDTTFIDGLKDILATLQVDKGHKLEGIRIRTLQSKVKFNCDAYYPPFVALGWHIAESRYSLSGSPFYKKSQINLRRIKDVSKP